MGTLQILLTELSGLKKPRGTVNRVRRLMGMKPKPPPQYRILVMMATNMPDSLDEALLRPGRIDRMFKVGYPALEGRVRTFEGYLAKVENDLTPEQVRRLATISPYASGASVKAIVNEALILAIKDERAVVTYTDVLKAKQLKDFGVPDDFSYIDRERHQTAIHEAGHAIAGYRLRPRLAIDTATIEVRGDIGGFVSSVKVEDTRADWRSTMEHDVMVSLASLAAERLFFDGDNSSGVGGDMASATRTVQYMLTRWAMGDRLRAHVHDPSTSMVFQSADTPRSEGQLGLEVEEALQRLYDRTFSLIEENRIEVLSLAHALEQHLTLSGEDVIAVIERRPGVTVDGRRYADPDVLADLERYHRASATAHREQGTPTVPLPIMPGLEPRPPALVGADAPAPWPVAPAPGAWPGYDEWAGNGTAEGGSASHPSAPT